MPQDKDELLQVLITKYAQMYMKLAYAIGVPYDDVEDIVMEAFWSFYRADYGGKLESEKAIKVMLARIVENKCIDSGVSLLAFEVYAFYIKSVARSFYSQLLLLWIPMRTKFPLCFLSAFFLMLFLIPFI